MGFYGNLTNVNKMQYSFDKTYANRYEMDKSTELDGVYVGRYVLIEYDVTPLRDEENNIWVKCYQDTNSPDSLPIALYISDNFDPSSQILFDEEQKDQNNYVGLNDIVRCIRVDKATKKEYFEYYVCSGNYPYPSANELEKMLPVFTHITSSLFQTYQQNQSIDNQIYTDGRRGYDSTVWQKAFIDGKEKYINIAELNAVIPTFDIANDPPTIIPNAPHLSEDSTNLRYVIHTQPQWGFRIKSAKPEPGTSEDMSEKKSDVNISFLDKNHYNPDTGTIQPSLNQYSGAIYYNKAGFNKNIRSVDTEELETGNYISVLPTGISGNKYNIHDSVSFETKVSPDVQELSIMLPILGNIASELWDLAYGDEQATGNEERNLSVDWGNKKGLRLVREDLSQSGFSYSPGQISNIAGCINSVHDLMGTIIVENSDEHILPSDASLNKIYYQRGEYWIKGAKSFFDKKSQPVDNVYPMRDQVFKLINLIKKPDPTTEEEYYWKVDNDYLYLSNDDIDFDPNDNLTYQVVNKDASPLEFEEEQYKSDNYFYKISNNYIRSTDPAPRENITYFSITAEKFNDPDPELKQQFYDPSQTNWFYEDQLPDGQVIYKTIRSESRMNPDKTYYEISPKEGNSWTIDGDGNIVPGSILDIQNKIELNLIDINPDIDYYHLDDNDNFIFADTSNLDSSIQYYTLTIEEKGLFYWKDRYFIKQQFTDADNIKRTNYVLAIEPERDEEINYYKINFIEKVKPSRENIYKPNVYWYQPNEEQAPDLFRIDTNLEITEDRKYYTKFPVFVESDPSGNFMPYEEWDISCKNFPEGLVLKHLTKEPAFIRLDKFARSMNTLNGLIIRINRILGVDNINSRDTETVYGLMNRMKDILNKYGILEQEKLIITGKYGKIITSDVKTEQDVFTFNTYNKESEPVKTQSPIAFSIEKTDTFSPEIILNHIEQQNITIENTYLKDLNNEDIASIELYKPMIDSNGHIVKQGYENITLPNGYKTFEDSNITKGQSIAQNLKDTLVFNGDNLINPVVTQGNITINHLSPNATASYTPVISVTPQFGETFNISDYFYDNKGHVFAQDSHTVTIPKMSLTDATATGADVITALSLNNTTGTFTSTRTNIGNLKITGYSKGSAIDTINGNDTINTAFGKLEYKIDKAIGDTSTNFSSLRLDDKIIPSQIVLAVAQTDGQISVSRDFLTKVALSGYESNTNVGPIASTQTLGEALGTLQNQITILDNKINNKDTGLVIKFNTLDDIVTNEVTGLTKKIIDLELIINDKAKGIEALNTKITAQDTGIEARLIKVEAYESKIKTLEEEVQVLKDALAQNHPSVEEPETPPAE